MSHIKTMSYIMGALVLLSLSSLSFANKAFVNRDDVQEFVNKMVKKHHFNSWDLNQLFSEISLPKPVIGKIMAPAEAKPWYIYRALFVTPRNIRGGVKFWRAHQKSLERAEKIYGVPASIIVATIGIESRYGKNKGKFNVLDTLSHLAFNYSRRARFFTRELEQYLLLTREQGLNPRTLTGSYAGAIGLPQFMPSSYRHYAVDFSGNKHIDLVNNEVDVIGSIANYYKKHGWHTNGPVALPASLRGKQYQSILNKDSRPTLSLTALKHHGISSQDTSLNPEEKARLIALKSKEKNQYWLTFDNFYVIMRYNSSKLYAMAVYELSQKIQEAKVKKT